MCVCVCACACVHVCVCVVKVEDERNCSVKRKRKRGGKTKKRPVIKETVRRSAPLWQACSCDLDTALGCIHLRGGGSTPAGWGGKRREGRKGGHTCTHTHTRARARVKEDMTDVSNERRLDIDRHTDTDTQTDTQTHRHARRTWCFVEEPEHEGVSALLNLCLEGF